MQLGGVVRVPETGAAPTVTVTDCRGVVCPFPVHWKVKVVVVFKGFVSPFPKREPAFDQFPLGAVQIVAFVEVQVSVALPPYTTEVGSTESIAVGVGFASEHDAFVPPFAPAQDQV